VDEKMQEIIKKQSSVGMDYPVRDWFNYLLQTIDKYEKALIQIEGVSDGNPLVEADLMYEIAKKALHG
jgi:hypothetical protein